MGWLGNLVRPKPYELMFRNCTDVICLLFGAIDAETGYDGARPATCGSSRSASRFIRATAKSQFARTRSAAALSPSRIPRLFVRDCMATTL